MSLMQYLLDKFKDSHNFEQLCSQVMLKDGYSHINPIGGTGDKGMDAEETIYIGQEGERKIIFQFSLQKNIDSKVKKTFARLKECGIELDELIFIFSTEPKIGTRDCLTNIALKEYGFNIRILGQNYLEIRLGSKGYRDIVMRFFGNEISELKNLYDQGCLFASDCGMADKEKRCLINLMHYARHPMAVDIKKGIVQEAIRGVLSRSAEMWISTEEICRMVFDYLPAGDFRNNSSIIEEIENLTKSDELEIQDGLYRLVEEKRSEVNLDIANIVASRRVLIEAICDGFGKEMVSILGRGELIKAVDVFMSNLFRKHGLEVANVILDSKEPLEAALEPDSVDLILSQIISKWGSGHARQFKTVIRDILYSPKSGVLDYLSSLSQSYICMQLLNVDPEVINLQQKKLKESVAVLDTDVLLTGIVRGSKKEHVSKAIVEICKKRGLRCLAFSGSVEEIEFRIKRSISLYTNLGCPTHIPADKKNFISDILLDVFFENLAKGNVLSFDEFIEDYYDLDNPREHVKMLIDERLGIEIEPVEKYYIIEQENKLDSIRKTIETSRIQSVSFKNPVMYRRDALAILAIEQQNREMIGNQTLGRWYLISGDRHIMKAYLTNKRGFKIKPSILPVYFLEMLRQTPEGYKDEDTFGAILESESMVRGAGKNYTHIIEALTKLGIKALAMPTERLIKLIDVMDRADFTQWLVRSTGQEELNEEIFEEIRNVLEVVIEEVRTRKKVTKELKKIKKEQEKKYKAN